MGTSSMFTGRKDAGTKTQTQTSTPAPQPSTETTTGKPWQGAKSALTRYLKNRGKATAGGFMQRYVAAGGGAGQLAALPCPGVAAGTAWLKFLLDVITYGARKALEKLRIDPEQDLNGVFAALLNALYPQAVTKEDAAAREALVLVISRLSEAPPQDKSEPDSEEYLAALGSLDKARCDELLTAFWAEYLWRRALIDFGSSIESCTDDFPRGCRQGDRAAEIHPRGGLRGPERSPGIRSGTERGGPKAAAGGVLRSFGKQ